MFNNKVLLVTSDRYCVRQSDLKKVFTGGLHMKSHKKYIFLLFNDILLYADRVSAGFQIKHVMPLYGMTFEDIPDSKKLTNAWRIKSQSKSITVYTNAPGVKGEWLTDLKKQIDGATKFIDGLSKKVKSLVLDEYKNIELIVMKAKASATESPSNAGSRRNTFM